MSLFSPACCAPQTVARMRSVMCVPIRARSGAVVAVLQLVNKRSVRGGAADADPAGDAAFTFADEDTVRVIRYS